MQAGPWKCTTAALLLACAGAFAPACAQTADETMQQVRTQARSDKRAFIAQQLQLDEARGKKFWPLYDSYQKDLQAINRRWNAAFLEYLNVDDKITDAAADKVLRQLTSIATDRAKLNQSYAKRFLGVLPGKQAARYFQLENKIRAVEEWDLAVQVPLVK